MAYKLLTLPLLALLVLPTAAFPLPAEAWYSREWSYRQELTINQHQVAENLTNFPVLVRLRGEQPLFHHAKPDGSDIIFVAADDKTLLDHELELYSPVTQELVVWVKLPQLSPTQPTSFYMYFGNTTAIAPATSQSVWQNGYGAVYLMNQGPQRLEVKDSTQSLTESANIKTYGNSREVTGNVGVAVHFDGLSTVIDAGGLSWGKNTDILPPMTISAWIKPETAEGTIIAKRDRDSQQWQLFTFGRGTLQFKEDETGSWPDHQSGTVETAISLGQWQYVAVTVDAQGTPTFYRNGVSEVGNRSNGSFVHRDVPTSIGARWSPYPLPAYQFQGDIDDVRVSTVARSFGWLKTEYNNQAQPDQFVTAGAVTNVPAPTSARTAVVLSVASLWSAVPFVAASILGVCAALLIFLLLKQLYSWIRRGRMTRALKRSPSIYWVKTVDVHEEV